PVIKIATAIEYDATDSRSQRALSDCLPDPLRGFDIAAFRDTQGLLSRRGCRQRLRFFIIDDLRVDMIQAAIDSQPRPLSRAANLATNTAVYGVPNFCSVSVSHFP